MTDSRCPRCNQDNCAVEPLTRLVALLDADTALDELLKSARELCEAWTRRKVTN